MNPHHPVFASAPTVQRACGCGYHTQLRILYAARCRLRISYELRISYGARCKTECCTRSLPSRSAGEEPQVRAVAEYEPASLWITFLLVVASLRIAKNRQWWGIERRGSQRASECVNSVSRPDTEEFHTAADKPAFADGLKSGNEKAHARNTQQICPK